MFRSLRRATITAGSGIETRVSEDVARAHLAPGESGGPERSWSTSVLI
jgi:hypothetical protein